MFPRLLSACRPLVLLRAVSLRDCDSSIGDACSVEQAARPTTPPTNLCDFIRMISRLTAGLTSRLPSFSFFSSIALPAQRNDIKDFVDVSSYGMSLPAQLCLIISVSIGNHQGPSGGDLFQDLVSVLFARQGLVQRQLS